MDSGTALREALERFRRRDVLLLLAAFLVVGVVSGLAQRTLLAASLDQYLASGGAPGALPVAPEAIRPVPLALPLGYGAAILFATVVLFLSEYLTIVALRVFTEWGSLAEAATHRVAATVVAGFLVGIVVKGLVAVGLLAFVLPGVFLAVSLLFAHARVAVAGDGVGAALRESWRLTEGHRFSVFGVLVTLLGLYLLPDLIGGLLPGAELAALVTGALAGVARLVSVGVVARAYVALEVEAQAEEESEEDQWNKPLGPDDLPEP